ncbi:type II toxin-antitoxin system VapC family toxin [Sphingomonas sp. PB2P19]|uniref:type II toxin-antitoxin system VapC family toxin n=1 Tax=Sphingomonas rhamnosi TaxID=3096156 RepID=UPI002FCA02FA
MSTSAFAMIVLQDPGFAAVKDWIRDAAPDPVVCDFGWGEFVSAVGLRIRSHWIVRSAGDRVLAVASQVSMRWRRIEICSDDIAVATGFVARYDLALRLPDAIPVALAQRLACTLVTTDHQQLRAARSLGIHAVDPTN